MSTYTQLLSGLEIKDDDTLEANIPENWMQGRTTYGGLTAALCHEAARTLVDDLPLRAAQVAFVGPAGGQVKLVPRLLRRGKNAVFVSVDMLTEHGVAAQSILTFGKARASDLGFQHLPMPSVPAPEDTSDYFGGGLRPSFMRNFTMRRALGDAPISGSPERTIGLWLRNQDRAAKADTTAILAIADCPPPAVMPMFKNFAPVSSMTWMIEFVSEDLSSEGGWYFAESTADTAHNGYSSQAMTLWNRAGDPIAVGRQTIAIFA